MLALCCPAAVLLMHAGLIPPAGQNQAITPDQRFQSALAHFNAGQYPAAQQELEPLAKSMPDQFEVQELLGLVYSAEGRDEQATALFERAVQLHPKDGPARNNLATNLAKLGKVQ